ncbi:MAG: MBL fold metallo-hydrolase [Desulfovermiculus sp.]|nr:MBL fold metallo-hydrolase [Desulfovermiculus sp.]
MLVKQIEVGHMGNFSYIVACAETKKAAIIDPGGDKDRILDFINEQGLIVEYILTTHFHFDHTEEASALRQETGARLAMHEADIPYYQQEVDVVLHDGDIIQVGDTVRLEVLHTPGHTPGGVCYYAEGKLFTGDTLFVGDSGRTDLPYGHRPTLGASIRRLMELPEDTVVMPGHDYGPTPTSTLRQEKRHNINAKEYEFYTP